MKAFNALQSRDGVASFYNCQQSLTWSDSAHSSASLT